MRWAVRHPWVVLLIVSVVVGCSMVACGPSNQDIARIADERVAAALTAMPTPTDIHFPTPLPTSTPQPTATPQPAATPQPTATPVRFPPSPTPQPTATPQPIADWPRIWSKVVDSVFYVETSSGHGTGWLYGPGYIITARHVIAGFSSATIRQSSFPSFTAVVVASDSQRDVALLQFAPSVVPLNPFATALTLGQISSANSGEPLMALGYSGTGVKPDGTVGGAAANVGVLSQVFDLSTNGLGLNLEMDVPVDPGDSGGPVFDAKGQVVGMSRAQGVGTLGTFFAVDVDEIRNALPALLSGQSR